jgi:hypothetical protein
MAVAAHWQVVTQYLKGGLGADRRRERQGHLPGLAFVPSGDQALGVLRSTWASVARLAAASASALAFRSASILRRLKPMPGS